MPKLIRLYIVNVAFGFALAAAFVGALVGLDIAGIGRLVLHSDMGIVAALMLWVFHGVMFAGVQFGIAVMGLAEDHAPRGGRLIPIRVEATVKATQRKRR